MINPAGLKIAQNLAAARRRKGGTGMLQQEAAKRLGMSRQALSRKENGESRIMVDEFVMMCHLYGISYFEGFEGAFAHYALEDLARDRSKDVKPRKTRRRRKILWDEAPRR